jgi:aryl-alcohol dehydrogenase-like predicted oxidoreductase
MVSPIGFGGAPIGIPRYLTPEDRETPAFRNAAIEAVVAAVERGISYFDTAPGYGEGRSEELIGIGLAGQRDQVTLATKFPFVRGREATEYTRHLRVSLKRLQTEWVDVLQVHGSVWTDASAEEFLTSGALEWAEEMRQQGLCRFVGITAEGPSGALERLLRTGRFDVIEIAYSVIYQSACDYQREPTGIIPLARSLGIGVTTMRPTTCGVLQKLLAAEFPEIDPDRLPRLAIRFVLSTPEVDCAVVGMRSAQEVAENAALAENGPRIDLRELHNRFT